MARSICYVTTDADAGMRLDALIAEQGLSSSRSAAAKLIETGRVLVGGRVVSKSFKVSTGQPIVVEVDESTSAQSIQGESIPLDIRYEDEDLIVLSKQAGLITHPCADHPDSTLVNALIFHCGADHLCNVQGEDDRLGIVHRLDGDTSGLMLAAKTNEAGQALMDAIACRKVDRHYLALVHGVIAGDTGMIDAPIERDRRDRTRMAVGDGPSSRDALTTFKVLERFEPTRGNEGYTLIECKLYTGRTHQIRVHAQYIKHPIVGDPVYVSGAPKAPTANLGLSRQFLHSWSIAFEHPITGDYMEFVDHLPTDLLDALLSIKERSIGITEAGISVFEQMNYGE